MLYNFFFFILTWLIIKLDIKVPLKSDTLSKVAQKKKKKLGVASRSHEANAACHSTLIIKVSYDYLILFMLSFLVLCHVTRYLNEHLKIY